MHTRLSILVVDDNQDVALNLTDILREKEYRSTAAFDGKSAIACCRESPFDLVLIDFRLPDMDGLELQNQLSEIMDADYIIITGYASIESAAEAVHRKQIVGYEIKPLDIDRLLLFIQQIQGRRQAEKETRKALAEKENLLQELYHRTKNNMQLIISMLSLQSVFTKDRETAALFQEIENKIRAMSLVHEKLYEAQNLSRIDLREYILDLTTFLMQSYSGLKEKVHISVDGPAAYILIDTAVPCGLIVTELISNAFKHAFPGGRHGEIRVSLAQDGQGAIELTVADNGAGAPEGFDFKNQTTLGIQSIFMIGEHQLKGTVEFFSNKGLSCRIRFKDTHYQERI